MDCGFISDVTLVKNTKSNEPIEDEFSHFINSNVQVFKDGSVKVVPKSAEEGEDISEVDPMEAKWLSRNQNNLKQKKNLKRKRKQFNYKQKTRNSFKRRKTYNKSVEQNAE